MYMLEALSLSIRLEAIATRVEAIASCILSLSLSLFLQSLRELLALVLASLSSVFAWCALLRQLYSCIYGRLTDG